jgi:hypothetical protein
MKLSQLRQIIREEIKGVMDEESNPINEYQRDYHWDEARQQCWLVDDEWNFIKQVDKRNCGK